MKPAQSTLERETTLPVLERIEFGIGDPRALMMINAKQYSDVTTAVIREYSTNAYDAHVMAGHSDPIEISLPSLLDPFFEVRDHGVGMSRGLFRTIYTQFGISDKRGRNDANGQLGIGSKSGLAYTTQFLVSSVMDGIKTEAKVIREPDWTLVMDIITEELTDEPNGTVIRIPVHNVDEFRTKAHNFYKFWLPGRVLIDGKPSIHHVGQKISDNLYYSKDWNTSYVVMANVAYRINNPAALFRESKLSQLNFVAYVDDFKMDDGAQPVEFTPSREDLEYSERTKNTLQTVINNFETDLRASAQAEINSAKTHADAYSAWYKWKSTLNANLFGDLEFKGEKFCSDFPVIGRKYTINNSSSSTTIKDWGVEACPRTVFIEDFDINPTSEVRRKVRAYCEMTWPDASISYYVFTRATSYDTVWVEWDKQMRVRWNDLKKALPKHIRQRATYSPGYRVKGSWDYYTTEGQKYEEPVPTDKTLLWISVRQEKSYSIQKILTLLKADDVAVLIVPLNRLAKLQRENPKLEGFVSWARSQVETDGSKLLSNKAKKIFTIDDVRKSWIRRLDMSRIDDPELQTIESLLSHESELMSEYNRHKSLALYLKLGYNGFQEYSAAEGHGGFYEKYPLIRSVSVYGGVQDDVYLYMNAKHKAESEKSK